MEVAVVLVVVVLVVLVVLEEEGDEEEEEAAAEVNFRSWLSFRYMAQLPANMYFQGSLEYIYTFKTSTLTIECS